MGWAEDILYALDAPRSADNVLALHLWAQSEGMPAWENNWLATTEPGFGGHSVNSAGVQAYPSESAGVAAIVANLSIPGYGYPRILDALRGDKGLVAIADAVNLSEWCKGCQNGEYPIALWQHIGGTLPAGGQTTVANPTPTTVAGSTHQAWDNLVKWTQTGWVDHVTGLEWIRAAAEQVKG